MFKRRKIGLALGGGGARGLAHIGVLKVLERYNIPIDMISGTSMGGAIGALYALEPNAKKLEKEVLSMKWNDLFDYTISRKGIIKGKKLHKFFQERMKNASFSELKIPLYITAFDIENRREVIFSKGDVAKAIRASIAIPGIFFPVQNGDEVLVDGGITDEIPNEVLTKKGADIIIAVNVNNFSERQTLYGQEAISDKKNNKKRKKKKDIPNMLKILTTALQVRESEVCKAELLKEKIDLIITPNVENVGLLDFKQAKKAIKAGEREAERLVVELNNLTKPSIIKDLLHNLKSKKK
jgi:NTE family protein